MSSDNVDYDDNMHQLTSSQMSESVPVNGNAEEDRRIEEEMAQVMKGLQEVVQEETVKRKSCDSEQAEGSNETNGGDGHNDGDTDMNGDVQEGPTPPKKPHVEPSIRELLPDLQKYWKPIEEDSNDFQAWTYLLQYVDQENEVLAAREAYDGFLSKYPYCYGYWKKYADYERRKGSPEECEKVFHRGIKAIPLSVDLWIHYLNYVKTANENNSDYVQEQFERAIQTVGMEFRSDKLWDLYIHYMKDRGHLNYLLTIYDRLLSIPTQCYSQHYQNLKELVNTYTPEQLLSEEELNEVSAVAKAAVAVDEENEDNLEEKTIAKIRETVLDRRAEVHAKTEAEIKARWPFEEAIKRPYFHVKPLEKGQLKNWKEYLEFEIAQGDGARIIVLFERCLIACALYEEYWIRYIRFLQSHKEKYEIKLREVFTRACTIHHPTKPYINLYWAAFEESVGNFEEAAKILESLEKHVPSILHLCFRRINLERRRGNLDACETLFEKYIADETKAEILGHLKIKYARFLTRWRNNFEKAKTMLKEAAVENANIRAKIMMALIDLSLDQTPVDFDAILSCFDQVLASDLPNEQKVTFAHRKIEFLEDYGSDMDSVEKAEEQLQSIAKAMRDKAAGGEGRPGDEMVPKDAPTAYSDTNSYGQSGANGPGYNQYGQYSNWNYQQSGGYGYNQQGWSAYGGYYG